MDNIFTLLFGGLVVILSGIVSFFVSRRNQKEDIETAKKIGKSEQKDEDRADVIEKADKQIETNEDVIKRSKQAIESV